MYAKIYCPLSQLMMTVLSFQSARGPFSYDFDDDDEMMEICTPLPEKGKGKSPKGRKPMYLKHKESVANTQSPRFKQTVVEKKAVEPSVSSKRSAEKLDSEQLKKTLLEHIEKRNLPKVLPRFAVRPAEVSPPEELCCLTTGARHPLPGKLWTCVFWYLGPADLARCQAVCRAWNQWCTNPFLWQTIDLSRHRIVQTHLLGIVRRQPRELHLNAVVMTQKQVLWLLERLPHLRCLLLSKCSWATLSGLCMSCCPLLTALDISWATGLNDRCFEDLIMPPVDRKPGVINVSRLHCLKSLNVAGSEISDIGLSVLTAHVTKLENLNISYCTKVSDHAVKVLTDADCTYCDTLRQLDVSGCRQLTDAAVDLFRNLHNLEYLSTVNCIRISHDKCRELQASHVFKRFNY